MQSITAQSYTDVHGLASLAKQGDTPNNMREVAAQFESMFMNIWLKSMREASHVFGEKSYLSSDQVRMHEEMLDQQMALSLSQAGGIGLQEAVLRQFGGATAPIPVNEHPAFPPSHTSVPTSVSDKAANLSESAAPTRFDDARAFVERLYPTVTQALRGTPLQPAVVLAQAALETGWGAKVIHNAKGVPSMNLFGLKAHGWSGPSVSVDSLEYRDGVLQKERSEFRQYDSWFSSVKDYAQFLQQQPRYQQAIEHAKDARRFADELAKAGYATDPNYAKKIGQVLQSVVKLVP